MRCTCIEYVFIHPVDDYRLKVLPRRSRKPSYDPQQLFNVNDLLSDTSSNGDDMDCTNGELVQLILRMGSCGVVRAQGEVDSEIAAEVSEPY